MKIGVVSDTHIPVSASKLPPKILSYFKDCDMIVHAGDVVEPEVLERLQKIAETKAVFGNMDSPKVKAALPEKIIFNVCGKSIGVTHGKGAPAKIIDTVKNMFSEKMDVIIFGHSHAPYNETIDGTLLFNPGSPTDTCFAPYRSFGIIEIDETGVRAEIIRIDE